MLHLMMSPNSPNFNVNHGILFIVRRNCSSILDHPYGKKMRHTMLCNRNRRDDCIYGYLDYNTNVRQFHNCKRRPADNPIAITIEVFQAAFIGLAAAIIIYEHRKKKKQKQRHGEGKREVEKLNKNSGKRQICPTFSLE